MPDHCPICTGVLYDSSDEQAASLSCLMCGRVWFTPTPAAPPLPGPIPAAHRGRPRKESIA